MSVAVVTIVHGRHDHLTMQEAALPRSSRLPDCHVVVAMDDPAIADRAAGPVRRHVLQVPRSGGRLPLARARNLGARAAIDSGASVLVFLDVDCLPSEGLVAAYERAAMDPVTRRDVLCGPVTYLPPPGPGGYDLDTVSTLGRPHGARPAPSPGSVERSRDGYGLFWSLSFALSRETWHDIGGFDEAYSGYGGEDTDFARRIERAGRAIAWLGDAPAFHQHHPVSSPPIEHVEDIVRNAALFHERWGEWPMLGWLSDFERRGLVRRGPSGGYELAR